MVNIDFYNTPNQENVINKVKNDKLTQQGLLIEPTDILNPVIKTAANSNILTKNYLYIDSLSRFYFITGIIITGAIYEISCRVDPIESFKGDFMNTVQVISRQENDFNVNLVDNQLPLSTAKFYQIIKVGVSPFHVEDTSMSQSGFYPFILNACNVGFSN